MALDRIGEDVAVIGRVTEASVSKFTAECYRERLNDPPMLGSFVVVEEPRGEIYAIVRDITTASIEPGRRPIAHMPPDADADAILADNPQLGLLLRTTFDALVVGYSSGGAIKQHLPPAAARIYARVRPCSHEVIEALTEEPDFLQFLLAAGRSADEVTAACLRRAAASHADPAAFRIRVGKALLSPLAQEPDRLTAILRSIEP